MEEEADSLFNPEFPTEDSWAVIGRLAAVSTMLGDNLLNSTGLHKMIF